MSFPYATQRASTSCGSHRIVSTFGNANGAEADRGLFFCHRDLALRRQQIGPGLQNLTILFIG
jgi:hypothetical protein